ncbi:MAG: DUF1553 domain-containing protein, partial [Verrucomicrobiota bacterium]
FDTPTPFSSVGRRNRTNVPAQSLVLMNDKLIFEQAAFWANRLLKEAPGQPAAERLTGMIQTALGRPPAEGELEALLAARDELAQTHGAGPDDADVWADLAHTLFNLNDFIYVR